MISGVNAHFYSSSFGVKEPSFAKKEEEDRLVSIARDCLYRGEEVDENHFEAIDRLPAPIVSGIAETLTYFLKTFLVALFNHEFKPGGDAWRQKKLFEQIKGDYRTKYERQEYFYNHPESIYRHVEDLPKGPASGNRFQNREAHREVEENIRHYVRYIKLAIDEYPRLRARDLIRERLCQSQFCEADMKEIETLIWQVPSRTLRALGAYVAHQLGLTTKKAFYLDLVRSGSYNPPYVFLERQEEESLPSCLIEEGPSDVRPIRAPTRMVYDGTIYDFMTAVEDDTIGYSESRCMESLTRDLLNQIFFGVLSNVSSPSLALYVGIKTLKEMKKSGFSNFHEVPDFVLSIYQRQSVFLPTIVKAFYENLDFLQKEQKLDILPTLKQSLSQSPYEKTIKCCLGHTESVRYERKREQAEKEVLRTIRRKELNHQIHQPAEAHYVSDSERGFQIISAFKHYEDQKECTQYEERTGKDLKKTLENLDFQTFNKILSEMFAVGPEQLGFSDPYHANAYGYNLSKIYLSLACVEFENEKILEDADHKALIQNFAHTGCV